MVLFMSGVFPRKLHLKIINLFLSDYIAPPLKLYISALPDSGVEFRTFKEENELSQYFYKFSLVLSIKKGVLFDISRKMLNVRYSWESWKGTFVEIRKTTKMRKLIQMNQYIIINFFCLYEVTYNLHAKYKIC